MTTEEKYRIRKEMAEELIEHFSGECTKTIRIFDVNFILQSIIDAYDVNFTGEPEEFQKAE